MWLLMVEWKYNQTYTEMENLDEINYKMQWHMRLQMWCQKKEIFTMKAKLIPKTLSGFFVL